MNTVFKFPADVEAMLNQAPLASPEQWDVYTRLRDQILESIGCHDAFERLALENCTRCLWQTITLRQHQDGYNHLILRNVVERFFREATKKVDLEEAVDEMADRYLASARVRASNVNLLPIGRDLPYFQVKAHFEASDHLVELEKVIRDAEARAFAIVRDIEKRRTAMARAREPGQAVRALSVGSESTTKVPRTDAAAAALVPPALVPPALVPTEEQLESETPQSVMPL